MSDNEARVPVPSQEPGAMASPDVVTEWIEQAGEAHALIARMYEDALVRINGMHEAFWTAILRPPATIGYAPKCGRHDAARVQRRTDYDLGGERDSNAPAVDTHV